MNEDCQHEDAYWDSCQQLDAASQRIKALEAELAAERDQRYTALKILYEHMGGPNPSMLVPAVKLATENALKTTRLCVEISARHQEAARAAEAELATERTARREAEAREAALSDALEDVADWASQGRTGQRHCDLREVQERARATLSQPSPAVERLKALEEATQAMLNSPKSEGPTMVGIDRDVYHAWLAAVQKVRE